MNPILMMLMMQSSRGKTPSGAATYAIACIYAVAWSVALVLMFGMKGLLVGWPCTIGLCLAIGFAMEGLNVSPGDFLMGVLCLVLLAAVAFMCIIAFG